MKCTECILNIAVFLISFSRQKRTKETPDNLNIYMFRYTLFPLVKRPTLFFTGLRRIAFYSPFKNEQQLLVRSVLPGQQTPRLPISQQTN